MVDKGDIKVSVLCLAYNHEKYIRKTLEGFVMQKTNFAFEVLVHDDASTDSTADIIREYEKKYPEIIKPIYQIENQHSKKTPITRTYLLPNAKGKYLAWCEGDDFWTDPNKLQKQVDFLDDNPEYTVCANKAIFHNVQTNTDFYFPNIDDDCDYSIKNIILHGGGLFATCSLMIRRDIYLKKPSCFNAKGFGDYQIYLYGSFCGKVRCLSDTMSQYNSGVAGSWTQRKTDSNEKKISHYLEFISMLNNVDKYYDHKYHRIVNKKISSLEYVIFKLTNDKKQFNFLQLFKFALWELRSKISTFLNRYCKLIVNIKNKILN